MLFVPNKVYNEVQGSFVVAWARLAGHEAMRESGQFSHKQFIKLVFNKCQCKCQSKSPKSHTSKNTVFCFNEPGYGGVEGGIFLALVANFGLLVKMADL